MVSLSWSLKSPFVLNLQLERKEADAYLKAMRQRHERIHSTRLMVVGMCGAGKSSLVNNLIDDVKKSSGSTEGIEVHNCQIQNSKWRLSNKTIGQRLLNIKYEDPKTLTQSTQDISGTIPEYMKGLASAYEKELLENSAKTEWQASAEEKAGIRPFISVWDFAGQNIYYSTHHFFLNNRSIYLLVMDVSKDINEEIEEWSHLNSVHERFTCMEAFKFWINSIHLYSTKHLTIEDRQSVFPTIFLVGTHKDKLPLMTEEEQDQYKEKYFRNLLKPFSSSPSILAQINKKQFLVNNLEPSSPVFEHIRQEVFNCASSQVYWNEKIPARWIELEKSLEQTFETDIITFDDVVKAGKNVTYKISDEDEIKAFLKIHHLLGNIFYFDTEELRQFVILDPSWVIVAFKTFINHVREINPLNLPEHTDFESLAILKPNVIEEIMQQADPRIRPHRKQVLAYLEKMDVIAQPTACEKLGTDDDDHLALSPKNIKYLDYYVIPCLLRKAPDVKVLELYMGFGTTGEKATNDLFFVKSPVLSFVFKENFMPPAVFHRLQATCIRQWPIAQKGKDWLLYNGYSIFNFDDNFRFMIRYVDHRIYCQISGVSKILKRVKSLPNKAQELRHVLEKALKEILGIVPSFQRNTRWESESPYEQYVQCSCTTEPGTCLYRVKDFLYKPEIRCEGGPVGLHLMTRDDVFGIWFKDDLEQSDQLENKLT